MSEPSEPRKALPALLERTISESEYRTLLEARGQLLEARAQAEASERRLGVLRARLAALERTSAELPDLLRDLLPTLDDLDRAIAAAHERRGFEAVVEGVERVRLELERVLGTYALEPIAVVAGEPFDPFRHQTLEVELLPGMEAVVDALLRLGYRRGDQVLRRALVRLREP